MHNATGTAYFTGNGLRSYRTNLARYINGGCLSRSDYLISTFSQEVVFEKNASRIIEEFRKLFSDLSPRTKTLINIRTEPYQGENPFVLRMMGFLERNSKQDLLGAFVHGSLGTYEEAPYSDFDALVVINSEVFESKKRLSKVAQRLNSALSIMYQFDPLQHHGWFVLSEADLANYPEYYFPSELYRFAKSLFTDKGLRFNICSQNFPVQAQYSFNEVSKGILHKIRNRDYPDNLYKLKGLLSQFMLLPALYVQVRDKRGIYKKYSYDAARQDFSISDWSIMEEVSDIRQKWCYRLSPLKKYIMTRPGLWSRRLAKVMAPEIPWAVKEVLTDEFYHRMATLANRMAQKLP